MAVLISSDLSKDIAGEPLLRGVSFKLERRDRMTIAGRNGAGKTTLLRMLSGQTAVDGGELVLEKGTRVALHDQRPPRERDLSLRDYVLSGCREPLELEAELAKLERSMAQGDERAIERYAGVQARFDAVGGYTWRDRAGGVIHGLGFAEPDLDRPLATFSGGELTRGSLARALASSPDLLLLDEPTNHLDMPSVAWLSEFMQRYQRSFILISHDREFLNEQIARVVSFEPEGIRQYAGNYDQYVRQRAEEEVLLENKARNQSREKERMERFVERFKAKASKARQAQSRAKQLAKMEDVEVIATRKVMRISFPAVPRTVNEVVRVTGLRKAYGDHVVFPGVDLFVQRGEKIGIIGANGAGKTTLLKMIAGELPADGGEIKIGSNVQVGYYAQHHAETLHPDQTVYEEVSRANPDALPSRVRGVLGAFLFSGDDVDKSVRVLSGGERARVALARLLINPGSLLLMDEPSNHLDLQSSESLAESLVEYDGTLVFVSHNRSLVRRLATRIWNIEDGAVETYPGTLDEYMYSMAQRRAIATPFDDKTIRDPRGNVAHKAAPPAKDDDKQRKRREAEARNAKNAKIKPLEKKVADLEERIAVLEAEQKTRSAELSDPAVYDDAPRRNKLLSDFQTAQDKLDELNPRWEAAMADLESAKAALVD